MRNDFCSDYLEHSAKGKAWSNHKYVAKTKLSSGKWYYWYNLADYQKYLQKQGKSEGQNALANPNKKQAEIASKESPSVEKLIQQGSKGETTEEKTKNLQKNISDGQNKINEVLAKQSDSSSSKSKSSSSKSSGSSSSKSKGSKSSSSSKSKSSKKSSDSEKKSSSKQSSSKSKESTSKKSSQTKENTQKAQSQAKTTEQTKFTPESLKKLYGIKDEEVNKHESTEKLLDTIKSYSEGSFGYITAGDKVYKWSKENGEVVFKDYDTDKEVTLPTALTNIEEFRTDKKKKK